MTKIYVVERGVYADAYVQGAYATPELAMAANPGTFTQCAPGIWTNDLDWEDYARIEEFGVVPEPEAVELT